MVIIGIVVGVVASIIAFVAFARWFQQKELESASSRLDRARLALGEGRDAEALSRAGEAFWADSRGVYSAEDATHARDILFVAQSVIDRHSQDAAIEFEPLIRAFESIQLEGGSVPTELLGPVGEFLDDVAGDTYLASEILQKLESGQLVLDLSE